MITKQVADFDVRILEEGERERVTELLQEEEQQRVADMGGYAFPKPDNTTDLTAIAVYGLANTFSSKVDQFSIDQNLLFSRYIEETLGQLNEHVNYFELPFLIGTDLLEELVEQERFVVANRQDDRLTREDVLATHGRARKYLMQSIGSFFQFSLRADYNPVIARRADIRGQLASGFRREAHFRVASSTDLLATGEYRAVVQLARSSVGTYGYLFQNETFFDERDVYAALFNMANAIMMAVPSDGFGRIGDYYRKAAEGNPDLGTKVAGKLHLIETAEVPKSDDALVGYLVNISN